MKRPSHPTPAPTTPQAGRLESIRTLNGFLSVRSFWEYVGKDWQGEDGLPIVLSYEAVRPYHHNAKTGAWAEYLVRVATLFGYRVEWLITGKEPKTEGHAEAATVAALAGAPLPLAQDVVAPENAQLVRQRESAHRMLYLILKAAGVPQPGGMDVPFWRSGHAHLPYWAAPLAELRRRVWWNYMVSSNPTEVHEDTGAAEAWIGAALRGPLKAFGIDPEQMDEEALGDFITAMIPALIALAAEQRKQLANKASERQDAEDVGLLSASTPQQKMQRKAPKTKRKPTTTRRTK